MSINIYDDQNGKVTDCIDGLLFDEAYLKASSNKVYEYGKDRLYLRIEEGSIEYALMKWAMSDDTGNYYDRIFHGHGYSGSLREMRHTYFGENGYVFYLPGTLVISALNDLRRVPGR